MKVGIIGLEYAGKKGLFALLTGIKKPDGYQQTREEIGIVDVPDERIDYLAKFYNTEKKTYSKIEFSLLPSIEKGDKALDGGVPAGAGKALLEAKEVDMFAVVVRQFADSNVFHPLGGVDIVRDYQIIKDELIFADLFMVETRIERIEKQSKTKNAAQIEKEKSLMVKLKANLEKGVFLNKVALSQDELKEIKSLSFLTLRPIFVVVNCDEDKLHENFDFADKENEIKSINISIKIEGEVQQLDEKSKAEFLETMSLTETSLNRLIKFSYNFGNLISFLTAGPKEVRSWTIRKGSNAVKAAGTIHSDMEKGFIRAEMISFEDLKKVGSEAEAKKLAYYRLEGKEYVVQDGDIADIRFNISK
ncbi:MAG: hypothetical protein A2297_06680 [Elusimicrobia bacterium RIFOXYB2_FULL_48_7]|nr:MAG: hypothetical protein A2297_06680 [Elusimicrobia bacterium RIFOXYB2_FULL_48_7]